jgi:hypothetical protein
MLAFLDVTSCWSHIEASGIICGSGELQIFGMPTVIESKGLADVI